MKALVCEMCHSNDVVKQDGMFVCQSCGTRYTVEEAKKMMIEGTVDVQGTVKVDNSALVAKYLANAHRALAKEDWEEVEKYYNLVEQNVPDNIEAVFFSSYGKAMLSMIDSDYFKREQKFQVLNRSMSVISDYYDTTRENKEEVLKKIAEYIQRMYYVTFVYQKKGFSVVGSRQWGIDLIDSTKATFITELKQIAVKHDEKFIQEIIRELGSQTAPSKVTVNPVIFSIIGLIFGYSIPAHVFHIIGIVLGVKEYKKRGKSVGMVLSSIGEAFAVIMLIILFIMG